MANFSAPRQSRGDNGRTEQRYRGDQGSRHDVVLAGPRRFTRSHLTVKKAYTENTLRGSCFKLRLYLTTTGVSHVVQVHRFSFYTYTRNTVASPIRNRSSCSLRGRGGFACRMWTCRSRSPPCASACPLAWRRTVQARKTKRRPNSEHLLYGFREVKSMSSTPCVLHNNQQPIPVLQTQSRTFRFGQVRATPATPTCPFPTSLPLCTLVRWRELLGDHFSIFSVRRRRCAACSQSVSSREVDQARLAPVARVVDIAQPLVHLRV